MKGLLSKLVAPLVVAGAIAIPVVGSAQERKENFTPKNYISVGVGGYQGTESMQDMYGTIPRVRAAFGRDMSKNFRLEGAIAYGQKEGTPILIDPDNIIAGFSLNIKLLQGEAIAQYVFPGESVRFKIGGGLSYISMTENLSVSGGGQTASASGTFSAAGPLFLLGLDIPISTDKKKMLYFDISGRSAEITTDFQQKVDIGGGVFEVGIKFVVD